MWPWFIFQGGFGIEFIPSKLGFNTFKLVLDTKEFHSKCRLRVWPFLRSSKYEAWITVLMQMLTQGLVFFFAPQSKKKSFNCQGEERFLCFLLSFLQREWKKCKSTLLMRVLLRHITLRVGLNYLRQNLTRLELRFYE